MTFKTETIKLDPLTADPPSPADGEIWHRPDIPELRARLNGATVQVITSGAAAFLGEAPPNTEGMVVQSNDNLEIGTFINHTTAAVSKSGSTFSLWQGTAALNTLFIGGDRRFPGVQVLQTTALSLGAGAIIWEFWNGAVWVAFDVMATDRVQPFDQFGNATFERPSTQEHVYFDSAIISPWSLKILNGFNKFWVRVRITTGITTVPVGEHVLLETNVTIIHADGFRTFSGAARPERSVQFHRKLMDAIAGSAPVDEDINVSANIVIGALDNQFSNGAVDALGLFLQVPSGLDTSQPTFLDVSWWPLGTGGNVEFEVLLASLVAGDLLDGSAAETNLSEIVVAPAIDTISVVTFPLPLASLVPGDYVALKLERDATGGNPDDTLASAIAIAHARLRGKFWR